LEIAVGGQSAVQEDSARSAKRLLTVFAGKGAANFLFAGSSAFLLLCANLFPDFWYLSFFALTPFLWRIVKVENPELCRRTDSKTAFQLGFLFGFSFFSYLSSIPGLFAQKVHLLADDRAPPASSF